ncbi:MAG: polysaccharide biosynthesis protein [Tetragenococcus koreensis]|uniref:PssD/Cps14F family polysaccharide biosynthesis glycosyltransferase n=1 Tax=Tetragenococcus halophilus TaxID=51669 RepID=UPI000B92981B|nr:PssD/Cps14F family polysaccharide biosynthesis glycosyltransferase [Tetragenococcus halophilus]MDN6733831.1 polysaccharide biosynthesis protein [Tetragenococcus koreensis]GFK23621.1 UDP-N-acetylglucosamine--N-acetylmuramyl-(pentapeptide) pyrophosphoryl-undecaprenol N-acetylglucosamine transferase [Tetragenococcus halophilus]
MCSKKICLISSSGGHFEQLLTLKKLKKNFDIYVVTEKTDYFEKTKGVYYIQQVNRREKIFLFRMVIVFFQSLRIFIKEKPDVIISTGALSVIPTFLIGKLFGKKLIFIESFAKISTPTLTGKFVYRFVDKFFIQWAELKKIYPDAICLGSIY